MLLSPAAMISHKLKSQHNNGAMAKVPHPHKLRWSNLDAATGNATEKGNNGKFVNPHRFFYFLIATCIGFLGMALAAIGLQEKLVRNGTQDKLLDYLGSFILLYGYIRMTLHVYCLDELRRGSAIIPEMPVEIQQDTAFLITDACSNFLWAPAMLYVLVELFRSDDPDKFVRTTFGFAKAYILTYQADRVYQLFVHYRTDRCLHHFLTLIWALFVFEWVGVELASPILVCAATLEGFSKPQWYWCAALRFCRKHARAIRSEKQLSKREIAMGNQDADMKEEDAHYDLAEKSCSVGLDRLFIPTSSKHAARMGKMFFCFYILLHVVVVPGCCIAYKIKFWETLPLFWKVSLWPILIAFNYIDRGMYYRYWEVSRQEYWEKEVFLGTCYEQQKKEVQTVDEMNDEPKKRARFTNQESDETLPADSFASTVSDGDDSDMEQWA